MLKVAGEHGLHFDTVQMPLNVMDAHFRSFGQMVLPELVKQEIGVLGMKSMGDSVILKSKVVTPIECLHYALSWPTSVVITGIDKPEILDQACEAAKTFQPMNREQIAQLLAKTNLVALRLYREASGLAGRGYAGSSTVGSERVVRLRFLRKHNAREYCALIAFEEQFNENMWPCATYLRNACSQSC
jgi:hypothetical protein